MEATFPRNVHSKITVTISSSKKTIFRFIFNNNENEDSSKEWIKDGQKINKELAVIVIRAQVLDSINYRIFLEDYNLIESQILLAKLFFFIIIVIDNISMLKRSYSMEFDSEHFKSTQQPEGTPPENEENIQNNKKLCNSPERLNLEDKSLHERNDPSPENNNRRSEPYRRYPQTGETSHVTQSKSIFSHEDSIVYGNPKDDIKNIENPSTSEVSRERSPFDNNSINVLDLSCKSTRSDEEKEKQPSQVSNDGNTYQSYHKSNYETPFNRSNLEIKLVNPPTNKKPSIPEQLQIAKIQQQQRRSIQQQQKMLQQMRKSLDSSSSSTSSTKSSNRTHHTNNMDTSQGSHKNTKHYGNNTSNHEQNDVDNHARMKEEYHPSIPGTHFPPPQYPYFDPAHIKELPDGHPILPLLDPVYFSAFYNAHGFLPPSSPSIAAAFIGTLQDALPKLPMMFPSTSSYNSSLLPQKSNENPN